MIQSATAMRLSLSAIVFFIAGCASPSPRSQTPSAPTISSLTLNPKVRIVAQAFVQTPGQVWGAGMGGALGGAIAGAAGKTNEERYAAFLLANQIDLRNIVRTAFEQELTSAGSPVTLVPEGGDADLIIDITLFGIHGAAPFSIDSMEPMLVVRADLYRGRNVIWLGGESMKFPGEDDVTPHTMDEYLASPKLLADGYSSLSKIIASSIIRKLGAANKNGQIK